jgi:hypothetical protein
VMINGPEAVPFALASKPRLGQGDDREKRYDVSGAREVTYGSVHGGLTPSRSPIVTLSHFMMSLVHGAIATAEETF